MKSERHVRLCTKFVKSVVNKAIGHVNEKIGHVKEEIKYQELEKINVTNKCADKDKKTPSAYDTKGKEKTLRKYEKK